MASVIFIDNDRIKPKKGTKVIKASDYLMVHEADAVLEKARNRAQEILSEANKKYQAEIKRGFQEGLNKANQEMSQKIIALAIEVDQFHKELEVQAVTLVMEIVKKVLKEIDPAELIVGQVKKALDIMKTQQSVILKVHPGNMEILNNKLSEITASYPTIKTIGIKADRDMSITDLILESPTGILEAGLNVQLKSIEKAFNDVLK